MEYTTFKHSVLNPYSDDYDCQLALSLAELIGVGIGWVDDYCQDIEDVYAYERELSEDAKNAEIEL